MSPVMNTSARQPVAFVRGEGVWLWDEAGKKYLDALAGIAVNTLGYAHPRFLKAINDRVKSGVIHTSNLFRIPDQEAAADRVAEITGLDEVFFCNSGLEATEASIKVARKYGHDKGIAKVRPQKGHPRAGHHRDGKSVPRPLARHAVGHRQPQGASRLRAAGARLRARAAQRSRCGAPDRRA